MIVLDTDHASELTMRSAKGLCLLERLSGIGDEVVVVTAITVEEQLRGWLAEIRRHHDDPVREMRAYARLVAQVELLAGWTLLPWDEAAFRQYSAWRAAGVRVGTQDLKIAAITKVHEALLLTRNTTDFAKVPGLRVENWLDRRNAE